MATAREQQAIYDALETQYGARIAQAFQAAVGDLKTAAEIERLVTAIAQRDLDAAIDALHLDAAAFNRMLDEIRAAYIESGNATASFMPIRRPDGVTLRIRFDGRNPNAEAWLRTRSSSLITRITNDTREGVREALTAAMARGDHPRSAAVQIVGRYNPTTRLREGGLLGLSAPQTVYVENARRELASTDPAALNAYLGRVRRNKLFDRAVRKALKDGTPIPAETQRKALNAYQSSLEALRAETIGRVEAMSSLQAAKRQAYLQAVQDGKIAEDEITRIWKSAHDFRVRFSHAVLDGKKASGLSEPFVSVTGARMLHPMDSSMGATGEDIIGCRCDTEYRIDWLARIKPASATAPQAPTPPRPAPAARPPVSPAPVAPPEPAATPAQASFRSARLPTNVAEAHAYIRAAGIANGADLTGMAIRNIAPALNAAHETVERFGLSPLDFIGPISRWDTGGRRINAPKNANAAVFTGQIRGQTISAFHMPTKFASKAEADQATEIGARSAPKFAAERDSVIAQRQASNGRFRVDPAALAAARSVPEGRYGWSVSSLSGEVTRSVTTYHEFGHVLHLVDKRIGPDIDAFLTTYKPLDGGWQFALSKYAGANPKEYVAEAFALYMSAPAEHQRIHPALLAIFKRYDRDPYS